MTYYQNTRRAIVAYDDDRLVLLFKASMPEAVPTKPSRLEEGGGPIAMASFDGGKTWGGLRPGRTAPVQLSNWYWRAVGSGSYLTGDLFLLGTQNCASYNEGDDVFFRRLTFDGTGWSDDRFSIIDQNLCKCPSWTRALPLSDGRILAAWTDGWGGTLAKLSDDDGLTWKPSTDADAPAPRPLYQPALGQAPPAAVLLWPGTTDRGGDPCLPGRGRARLRPTGPSGRSARHSKRAFSKYWTIRFSWNSNGETGRPNCPSPPLSS